jgi:hypothetical protein
MNNFDFLDIAINYLPTALTIFRYLLIGLITDQYQLPWPNYTVKVWNKKKLMTHA